MKNKKSENKIHKGLPLNPDGSIAWDQPCFEVDTELALEAIRKVIKGEKQNKKNQKKTDIMNNDKKNLMKIEGISEITSNILEKIGINSPEDLMNANAEDIHEKLIEQKKKNNISYLSDMQTIRNWIKNAQSREFEYSQAKTRYQSLKERTFENALRIILYENLILKKQSFINVDEVKFIFDNSTLDEFKETFKSMKDVRKNNLTIDKWKKENKSSIDQLKQKYISYFEEKLAYDNFKAWYGKDDKERKCHYCEITEKEFQKLTDEGMIKTKRSYSRGKTLEIDRTEPNGHYEIENIELCCYWCNNSKTDEFDEKEFKIIGKTIGQVFKARLNKI